MTECRICLEGNEDEEFISPCRCSGSTGAVHESCLQRWRFENINNPEKFNKCDLCHEKFLIMRQNPKEKFYILHVAPLRMQYFCFFFIISFFSMVIGIIDNGNSYHTINMLGLEHFKNNITHSLKYDFWSNVSYYQSMSGFLFSIVTILFMKISSYLYLYQKCNYQKLMFIKDFNYMLTTLPYPFLVLSAHDLGTVELLFNVGAFLIIITIPFTVEYIRNHNKIIDKINKRYANERIMNAVYNPLSLEPRYNIIEMA